MFWFLAYKWILSQVVQSLMTLRIRVCLVLALCVFHWGDMFQTL